MSFPCVNTNIYTINASLTVLGNWFYFIISCLSFLEITSAYLCDILPIFNYVIGNYNLFIQLLWKFERRIRW